MLRSRPTRLSRRLKLRFSTGDGALPRDATTLNVSRDGLSLVTGASMERGSHLLGRLHLPDGKLAEVHGVVAWTRPFLGLPGVRASKSVGIKLLWAEPTFLDYLARA